MDMSSVGSLVVYLGLISAVAERVTAAVKHVADLSQIKNDKIRAMVIQAFPFGTALIAAAMNPPTEIPFFNTLPPTASMLVVALLGSVGSNVWYDMLSTLTAVKTKVKQDVIS